MFLRIKTWHKNDIDELKVTHAKMEKYSKWRDPATGIQPFVTIKVWVVAYLYKC